MMVFALDAPGQEAAGLINDLAGSCQQLHHRPYLPRGFPERILLLLTSLLEVRLHQDRNTPCHYQCIGLISSIHIRCFSTVQWSKLVIWCEVPPAFSHANELAQPVHLRMTSIAAAVNLEPAWWLSRRTEAAVGMLYVTQHDSASHKEHDQLLLLVVRLIQHAGPRHRLTF